MANSEQEYQIEAEIHLDEETEDLTEKENPSGDMKIASEDGVSERIKEIKSKRKNLRGRITRTINRIRDSIKEKDLTERRAVKIKDDLRKDLNLALELHSELYDSDEANNTRLDKWESEITNDVYTIEERMEDYLSTFRAMPQVEKIKTRSTTRQHPIEEIERADPPSDPDDSILSEGNRNDTEVINSVSSAKNISELASQIQTVNISDNHGVDSWIDNLEEFKETKSPDVSFKDISVADALFRIEARKEIPNIQLTEFDGSPFQYVEFVESFKVHIHDKPNISDNLRMAQLKMLLTRQAKAAVSGLGSSGIMYATALKTLKEQFGQPSVITRAFINKVTKGEVIRSNDREGLRRFSTDIINCLATLKRLNHMSDVNASESLRMIIRRLPDDMIPKWKNVASNIRERGDAPTLQHISEFLRKRVRADFDPDFGDIERSTPKVRDSMKPIQSRKGIHAAQQMQMQRQPSCYVCLSPHRITDCQMFKSYSVSDRVAFVRDNRLCYSCLLRGHRTTDCRSKAACGEGGCKRTHHPLLHSTPQSAGGAQSVLDKASILPVVRVKFRAPNGRFKDGNVLLDSGAGTTVIRSEFARSLGLQGKRAGLDLLVVGGDSHRERNSRRLKFWISPMHGGEEYEIEANEIDKTVCDVPPLDTTWLNSFRHLDDICFHQRYGPVDMILGVQYSHIHAEQEVREGLQFEPVAKRTRLGWAVLGSDYKETRSKLSIGFCEKIDIDIEKMYNLETVGVQAPDCECQKISPKDREVLEMFESSCKLVDKRYSVGLPWMKDPRDLPNNYTLAEKRLTSLERGLLKNPQKAEMYCKVMKEYERNGWSERVEEDTQEETVYYLPHHGVVRLDKASTPLRVVFDPACSYNGMSLNSFLHKGPSTLGDLLGILIRFREKHVAFVGDISKMFLQICLPERDTHLHRYLWRDMDLNQKPKVYRLLRVTFGDKSSPEMANFIMRKIAETNKDRFPGAAEILQRDRYMDDLIHSCDDENLSVKLRADLDTVLATGSFKVKEWQSSEEKSDDRQKLTAITGDKDDKVKTLGVSWCRGTDSLHFTVKHCSEDYYTKRSVLSKIATVFDPLGLASVVTIRARIAMQEIWKMKHLDWDDRLPEEMCQIWSEIFDDLERLNFIQFPRCLKPTVTVGTSELHVFADASMTAYGSCAYLLWPTPNGPSVRLVAAKVRVAPLRQTTIPRLELMAALLASRLARTLHTELRDKPEVFLWSDSQVVLKWLQSESSSKKAFVAVRIAEIQGEWDNKCWRYVPTKQNVADDLSRGIKARDISYRWLHGPEFLQLSKEQWPDQDCMKKVTKEIDENEDRKTWPQCLGMQTRREAEGESVINSENYSSWRKLLRVTAYCLRFVENLKNKVKGQTLQEREKEVLQPIEIQRAEYYWVHSAQSEILNVTETCADLAPFDDNGILRVGGRLRYTPLSYDERHPMLLPPSSHITRLILNEVHAKVLHAGAERTLSESRRRFWVIRGRNVVKNIVNKCVVCRKLRKPPHTTLMADLPPERLKAFSPPFTTTGVDLFGPFNLKYGRNKTIKAWGALFTCATVRAIHLEIVENLSTQAFLHALRRFVSHHGWPKTMLSDNGTCFVGAEKELRKLIVEGRAEIENFSSFHNLR